jgi:hypothetical protein
MKIEIELEGKEKGETDEQSKRMKCVEEERKEHPWMTDAELMEVVMEHLEQDPEYYEKEETGNDEQAEEEKIKEERGRKSDKADPFSDYEG